MKICTVEGCKDPRNAKGLCNTHYHRMRRNGTLKCRKAQQSGANNPGWRGERAGYTTVHSRLRSTRGPASRHLCVGCGSSARDWAYTYGCSLEQESKFGPYSTDLDKYQPMCRACHKQFDRNKAGLVPA